ncbi:sugar MFS transporter [Ochrovirga pacifica]|uniref:sugar MFS transporter n=1 Tax=Ochrovirga pacifica TaxID=1042376 RepID=UPI00025594F0|nr:sugar MFS transporter [Ochrovirga pacifica]
MKTQTWIPTAVIAGLFFIFGFVTWINGALIPYMKTINELTEAQSYLVASAFYISYVVMALPASKILEKIGYKKGMSLGLFVMALGALVFIPAANSRTYVCFLLGLFIQGSGLTILQTAANPYITILGPLESAAKRIAIMGIANKIAGAIGSIVFASLLLSGIDEVNNQLINTNPAEKELLLNSLAESVVNPYLLMAFVLFLLTLGIRKAPLPEIDLSKSSDNKNSEETTKTSIFQFPYLWLGVLTLFVYVGAEVVAGDTIISYGKALGIPSEKYKFFTSFTLMSMVLTYAIGVYTIPKFISQHNALKISALLGLLFSVCILCTSGFTSVLFVAALGIANALVWPAVWPLSIDGLGKFTKTGSALLIMAIAGGATIPPLYGMFVDFQVQSGTNIANASTKAYGVLIPCYAIILFFATKGHLWGKHQ